MCYKVAETSDKETSVKTKQNYQKTRYLHKDRTYEFDQNKLQDKVGKGRSSDKHILS